MIEDNVRRKLEELISRASQFGFIQHGTARNSREVTQCNGWLAEALHAVELAVPIPDNAYRRQITKIGEGSAYSVAQRVASIAEILRALVRDIDAGLITDLGNKIRAETFDNFLDHAESYQEEGRKQEAGVIAGVVFEDTVRRIFRDKVGDDKSRPLEELINALAKQGTITGQQSKQAKVAAHVRTKATHAQWDEFDMEGVTSTIQITRLLLREHLGG